MMRPASFVVTDWLPAPGARHGELDAHRRDAVHPRYQVGGGRFAGESMPAGVLEESARYAALSRGGACVGISMMDAMGAIRTPPGFHTRESAGRV